MFSKYFIPRGVLRIIDAIDSPWLKVTLDTGNFLEDPYERLSKLSVWALYPQHIKVNYTHSAAKLTVTSSQTLGYLKLYFPEGKKGAD